MVARQRLDWIDVAKGASILLVVLYHTNVWLDSYHLIHSAFGQIDRSFRPIRMPMFFAVSGYLAAGAVKKGWRNIIINKVALLLYLYGIWSIVQWLLFRFTPVNNKALEIGENAFQVISVWYAPTSGLWFIWALAIYFVIARATRAYQSWVVLFIAALIAIIFMSRLITGLNFAQFFVLWYLSFFLGGLRYGHLVVGRITTNTYKILIVCTIVFVGATILVNTITAGLSVGVGRLVQSCSGLVAGCAASVIASRMDLARSLLSYLGRNTLPIFLTHEMVIEICALLIERYHLAGKYFYYFGSPALAVFALSVSLILYYLALFCKLRFLYELPTRLRKGISGVAAGYALKRAVTPRTQMRVTRNNPW